MLTKRYFNEITTMLRQTYEAYENHIIHGECPVYPTIVHHLNSFFWHDNPNHDTDRFLQASGYDEYAAKIANKDPRQQLEHDLTVLVRTLRSLGLSPQRIYSALACLLQPSDGVVAWGYWDEASGFHEPCLSDNEEGCTGKCLSKVDNDKSIIIARSFGTKFYFIVVRK
jgi:hypothetical protein